VRTGRSSDIWFSLTPLSRLRTAQLYRAARPDEASTRDKERLVQEYKIKSIIDLRTKLVNPDIAHAIHAYQYRTEHIEQAQKRDAKIKASAAVPQTNDDVAEPLKIPGIRYHEININGSAFGRMLMSKLSWLEFSRLVGLMTIGRRNDAVKILAPHMEEMGLVGLAKNSLDVCKKEVRQVFEVLGNKSNWPVLVHCTQGKDRTGLIVMLVLFLLGVEEDVIDKDYRLSEPELASEKKGRLKELALIGLTEQFAVCPPDVVRSVHSHIQEKYGGVRQYLKEAGVGQRAVDYVIQTMLAET
jgi:protein-tyrosine phosphatase